MGVRRKYREQIDQCIDEMLMNALYDAPVDDAGKPLFADVPVQERVLAARREKALVQYGCDGDRFAVSVRDAFGTLRKEHDPAATSTSACTSPDQQIDRKAGGAGLGLYLICNSATEVVLPHLRRLGDRGRVQLRSDRRTRAAARARRLRGAHRRRARRPPQVTTIPSRRGRRHEDLGAAVTAAARRLRSCR